ncbi:MAG: hypothetical protein RL016_596 [Actinomycetota bacterium]
MAKNNEENQQPVSNAEAAADVATETPYEQAPATKTRKRIDLTGYNTLSIVSIATALTGFGAVAGVITGHVALNQLKTDGKQGRGLALAGVIVGYAGIGLAILSGLGKIALGIWGIKNGYGPSPFGDFDGMGRGHMDGGQFGGQMGQFGGDMDGGQMGGRGFGDDDMGGMMVDPNQPNLVDPNQPLLTPNNSGTQG